MKIVKIFRKVTCIFGIHEEYEITIGKWICTVQTRCKHCNKLIRERYYSVG